MCLPTECAPWPCCLVESCFRAYTPARAPKPMRTILHPAKAAGMHSLQTYIRPPYAKGMRCRAFSFNNKAGWNCIRKLKAIRTYTRAEDTACGDTPRTSPIHSQAATSMPATSWTIPGPRLGLETAVGASTLPGLFIYTLSWLLIKFSGFPQLRSHTAAGFGFSTSR